MCAVLRRSGLAGLGAGRSAAASAPSVAVQRGLSQQGAFSDEEPDGALHRQRSERIARYRMIYR
jgi:hypothetical protein